MAAGLGQLAEFAEPGCVILPGWLRFPLRPNGTEAGAEAVTPRAF